MNTSTHGHTKPSSGRHPDIDGFSTLEALALDLSWTWSHCADKVWMRLDPELWHFTHNPWVVLQTVSRDKLRTTLADPTFRKTIDDLLLQSRTAAESPGWFQRHHGQSSLTCAAYFSMEYMLSEALPIYSGGLGNVAGDQLKAANDLGVPVVGLGLLYQQGYFRQIIDKDGSQQAFYPYNDPLQLPITPLRKENGELLRIEIPLPGWPLWLRAWQVTVGRLNLYLLDSNDAANYPAHRGITSELYGGGSELRLQQELLLALGGWRLLQTLGIKPEVCHLNEGHAAFVVLERASSFMKETGLPFDVALAATRAGNLFTTHTAVAAGFDRFSPELIRQYLERYAKERLHISMDELLALGRQNPGDASEPFNMAYLAIRGSGSINGVSKLHGRVSRQLFSSIFPRWPEDEVPVDYVTNGVHMPTWDSKAADGLWETACGKDRWLGSSEKIEQMVRKASEDNLWNMRNEARKALVDFARVRLSRLLSARGAPQDEIERCKTVFDAKALTLGFARRFATYKRPNLLLTDPERLLRILNSPERPVQLILAGKAHPADEPGKALIRQWMQFIQRPEARNHVIFLSDYDMQLTQQLVHGVDVWINTPRRPWEACGTSGMKVLANGGLNLSELDGWWAEAFSPDVGWAVGDGLEHGGDPAADAADAETLYRLLEDEIIPEFYQRNNAGLPEAWIKRVRESMARLTPMYSASRAECEYAEKHYLPAAEAFLERSADNAALAKKIVTWRKTLDAHWNELSFGELSVHSKEGQHVFEVTLAVGSLEPSAIQVQLYVDGVDGTPSVAHEMQRLGPVEDVERTYRYRASVPNTYPANAYTPRVVPSFYEANVPLEVSHILWQH